MAKKSTGGLPVAHRNNDSRKFSSFSSSDNDKQHPLSSCSVPSSSSSALITAVRDKNGFNKALSDSVVVNGDSHPSKETGASDSNTISFSVSDDNDDVVFVSINSDDSNNGHSGNNTASGKRPLDVSLNSAGKTMKKLRSNGKTKVNKKVINAPRFF